MSEHVTSSRQSRRLALQRFPIDGQAIKKLFAAGMEWLKTNEETVNALNVFPVPDGDTGTNMGLTVKSAYTEIENSPEHHAGKMLALIAQGALMGARGNSGVILSQLWRGLATALENEPYLTGKNLAEAFQSARDTAYKGVVKPVEGTILTVSTDIAIATKKAAEKTDDPLEILDVAVSAADESVKNTPELMALLKEAGVVDSGGMGLFFILDGMVRWINGQPLDEPLESAFQISAINLEHTLDAVEEGQDYEVVVDFRPNGSLDLENFYSDLAEMGTSIQVGQGEGMYRMHIHVPTENRYIPIDYCMELGTVTNVAIENLMDQMEEIEQKAHAALQLVPVEPGQIAVVTVAPGLGIAKVFASLGVAAIVEGGQSQNPSIQQILEAFENLPTDKIIILPNNSNIIMAANSAAELTVKDVRVVHTRNVPQGLAAMLRLMPQGELDGVFPAMEDAIEDVVAGEITTSVRNVTIDDVEVKEGESIALLNGKLVCSGTTLETSIKTFFSMVEMDEYELITLFHGADITEPEVNNIIEIIQAEYPDHEIELQEGGQPHYQFIISIE